MQGNINVKTLQQARHRKGWNRTVASKQTGLSVSHLRDLERGRRQPSFATAYRLARAYNIRMDELAEVVG